MKAIFNLSDLSTRLLKSSLIVISASALINNTAIAEPTNKLPIFADVTINNSFSPDPLAIKGMSGGKTPAKEISGTTETSPIGTCDGYVDPAPNHKLTLNSKFDYLKLIVNSPQDTTLIIKGPGGTWCNNDFDGKNPGMVGEWLKGTYEIWVGSDEKDKYYPYKLTITEVK